MMRVELPEPMRSRVTCFRCQEPSPGCCHLLVSVHLAEALNMYAHHYEAIEARIEAVLEQAREEVRVLGESPIAGDVRSCATEDTTKIAKHESRAQAAWFDLARPCSLLGHNGRCSVYEHRPVTCAAHFVVTPSALCSPTGTHIVGRVDAREAHAKSFDVFNAWCVEHGLVPRLFFGLARAVLFARIMIRSGWTP